MNKISVSDGIGQLRDVKIACAILKELTKRIDPATFSKTEQRK